ncbi:SigB/SigF/SigG family RNA polymerase sigma factor [soil metagenome]
MQHAGPGRDFDEQDALRRYGEGDPAARAELIEHHLPLARRLAGRYRNSGEASEDLEQVASLGLIKAIDRYRPDAGPFARFAVPTIVGELKRHFRDKGWGMHVPRYLQERVMEVNDAIERLSTALGRSPSPRDIAEDTGHGLEEVLEAMHAAGAYSPMSLDSPQPGADDDQESTLGQRIGAEDDRYKIAEWRPTVGPAMASLPAREREILRLRFAEDLTQSEIATRIGVSQMHVSRLLRRSLEQLSAAVKVA